MLIGISGKMGTGKSTLVTKLMNRYKPAAVVKVAGYLYQLQDMIYETLEMDLEGEKDRALLIALGMWGRDKDQNFWTHRAIHKANNSEADFVFIDDIRFPNEAKAIEDAGGVLIRIDGEQRGDNLNPEAMQHETETALDDYPFKHRVDNLLTIKETERQARIIIDKHL